MYYELYHHGIPNQKWGVRNGPPYPLSRSVKKTIGDNNSSNKKRLTKEEAIKKANAKDILPYVEELSNKELIDALNRVKWKNELATLSTFETKKGLYFINSIMRDVGMVTDWGRKGSDVMKMINNISKFYNEKKMRNE